MRSDFEPKRIKEARETLGRQLEHVEQMLQAQEKQEREAEKRSASLFSRLAAYVKRLF